MAKVRVLAGTKKGAFILTADGKRKKWDVSGPHFAGWEIYHMKGSPADPEPHLRVADERLVRADDPALERRRQDLGAGGQQVRVRGAHRHAPVVRRHAASVGVQARVAPRAVADDPDTVYAGVEDAAIFKTTDGGANWKECPACAATAPARTGQPGAGGMCLHTILIDPDESEAHVRRDLGGRRVPHR